MRKKLMQALEEHTASIPVNDSEPMVETGSEDPNAKGEVVPVIAAESNESMPENDTQPLVQEDPENPHSEGKVVEIGSDMVEKGEATESGIQELEALAQESEEILVDISGAQDLGERVEGFRDAIAQGAANNDLTGVGAEILSTALENLYDRAGIKNMAPNIPSLVSFGTPIARARSASIALEEVDNRLAKIKEFIINMFKKMVQQGKEFLQKLSVSRKAIAVKIEKAAQEVKASPDTPVPNDKFLKDPSFFARFNIDGKETNLPQAIDAATKTIQYFVSNVIMKNMDTLSAKFNEIMTSGRVDPDEYDAWVEKYIAEQAKHQSQVEKTAFLGNYGFKAINFETKSLGSARIDFGAKENRPEEGDLRVLSKQEAYALLEQVKSLDGLIDMLNKSKLEAIRRENELLSKITGLSRTNYYGQALNDIVWQFSFVNQNFSRLATYLLNMQSGAGLYVSSSIQANVG